ncbi:hypothetical protein CH379_008485 [Leptospira ellisii]|uniref:Uncharacterized protein n=1 Tax=Leptospira ellisii TaxID=2023197 RepID=A0A2N0B862_9LEPT|nr:hypothetical protein [Leptospira ellisii]MDV6235660.1 hypothetical protein [Leptospira ellisii]PJZ92725.1 hypothetical protein CH379_11575 [Leptospira ellisii]PKA04999.1 hypothetical protein CH375_07710 [Leptospira ellisii]
MKSSARDGTSNTEEELSVSTGTLSLISRLLFPVPIVENLLNDLEPPDSESVSEGVSRPPIFLSDFDPNFPAKRRRYGRKGIDVGSNRK